MQKSKSTDGGCCTTIKSQEIIRKLETHEYIGNAKFKTYGIPSL